MQKNIEKQNNNMMTDDSLKMLENPYFSVDYGPGQQKIHALK